MRQTSSIFCCAALITLAIAISAPQAAALTRAQLNQSVELRVINQPLSMVVQTLMQGGKVPHQMVGEGGQEVTDWRFKGSLSDALRQLSSEFGLCFYSDGRKISVVNPGPGETSIVRVDAPMREWLQVLRSLFPWYSANAVKVDVQSSAVRLCGPASFLQPSLDALKSWEDNRLVIIR